MAIELTKLREPFAPSDIQWRIGQGGKKRDGTYWAKVLAYVTNRAIMDRLDTVVGPENWWNEYRAGPSGGVICGITIDFGDRQVTKWDGAENSDIEAVKGGLSDSMKRAAVQWGIGRYLYDLGESWAEIHDKGAHYGTVKVDGKTESFRWDHPRLPDWALPSGAGEPPAATVAKIEQQSGGKVQRASKQEKPQELQGAKITKDQRECFERNNALVIAATTKDQIKAAVDLIEKDLASKALTPSLADMLKANARAHWRSLDSMEQTDERFGGAPAAVAE